jgi:formylglycine-generating enzyme required for sulfatase activity
MADVYQGPGLKGIPRGTVKSLRVFTYHFGYQRIAGIDHRVGADGPWEVKRILGTVPVEADGSALFSIPAKTPISVQPLDEEGKAIQLMRSWMTAMPGETLSCIGCHDQRNTAPTLRNSMAFTKPPREIQPWYGPARNFSFRHEVQPVLDRFCVGCHNGSPPPDRQVFPDLRAGQGTFICFRGDDPRPHVIRGVPLDKLVGQYGGIFEPSYIALRRLVRVAGLESDLHLLPPTEFHADNNELIQMLKKGHHGVDLNAEAWDRLYTWIDLNAPSHGTWGEFVRIDNNQRLRRCQLRRLYQGVDEDGEDLPQPPPSRLEPIVPTTPPSKALSPLPSLPGWPLTAAEANRRQKDLGEYTRTLDLGGGVILELARLPAGRFLMGDPQGNQDERPLTAVTLDKPIWMGRCEVTNEQYARFDPTHRSRFEHRGSWIFSEEYLGWPLDGPRQPVVRVSWNEAQAFCRWLGQRCGLEIDLPTEAQWEYACRAGTATPFSFGNLDTDFGPWANLADQSLRDLAYKSWRPRTPDLAPRDDRFNDRALVSIPGGSFRPNTWGLFDMHGNVAEWTRTAFRPYPYVEEDGRNGCDAGPTKVVRGGSWRDRPMRCRSAFRLSYPPYQKVYNVGFRIVCK